jgi:type II secretory ATPase GspE/PulE/Tfp pilus assembly ATPase PilB-like protein
MSVLFYREERDEDFFNVCESVRAKNTRLSIIEIARKAILRPAKSFYLHPREYSYIIRLNGNRLPKNVLKRELHNEILKRFKAQNAKAISSFIKVLSQQEAPRFYISESRAANLYYDLLKKQRKIL